MGNEQSIPTSSEDSSDKASSPDSLLDQSLSTPAVMMQKSFSKPSDARSRVSASSPNRGQTPSERSSTSSHKRDMCYVCSKISAYENKFLVACSRCKRKYHRGCHKPIVDSSISVSDWKCFRCAPRRESVQSNQAAAKRARPDPPRFLIGRAPSLTGLRRNEIPETPQDRSTVTKHTAPGSSSSMQRPRFRPGTNKEKSNTVIETIELDGPSEPGGDIGSNGQAELGERTELNRSEMNRTEPGVTTKQNSGVNLKGKAPANMGSVGIVGSKQPSQTVVVETPPEPPQQSSQDSSLVQRSDESFRPSLKYPQLIGMALLEAPNHRLQSGQIYEWIAEHVPGYDMRDTSWRNGISVTLKFNSTFNNSFFESQPHDPNDKSKGGWWALRKGAEKKFQRWRPLASLASTGNSPLSERTQNALTAMTEMNAEPLTRTNDCHGETPQSASDAQEESHKSGDRLTANKNPENVQIEDMVLVNGPGSEPEISELPSTINETTDITMGDTSTQGHNTTEPPATNLNAPESSQTGPVHHVEPSPLPKTTNGKKPILSDIIGTEPVWMTNKPSSFKPGSRELIGRLLQSPKSSSATSTPRRTSTVAHRPNNKRSLTVVDLTLSDDDEPVRPVKRANTSQASFKASNTIRNDKFIDLVNRPSVVPGTGQVKALETIVIHDEPGDSMNRHASSTLEPANKSPTKAVEHVVKPPATTIELPNKSQIKPTQTSNQSPKETIETLGQSPVKTTEPVEKPSTRVAEPLDNSSPKVLKPLNSSLCKTTEPLEISPARTIEPIEKSPAKVMESLDNPLTKVVEPVEKSPNVTIEHLDIVRDPIQEDSRVQVSDKLQPSDGLQKQSAEHQPFLRDYTDSTTQIDVLPALEQRPKAAEHYQEASEQDLAISNNPVISPEHGPQNPLPDFDEQALAGAQDTATVPDENAVPPVDSEDQITEAEKAIRAEQTAGAEEQIGSGIGPQQSLDVEMETATVTEGSSKQPASIDDSDSEADILEDALGILDEMLQPQFPSDPAEQAATFTQGFEEEELIDRQAKMEEIRQRATRKQVFGKIGLSRLRDNHALAKLNHIRLGAQNSTSSAKAGEWPKRSGNGNTIQYENLEQLLEMPERVVPFIHETQLAFRDYAPSDTGRVGRPKVIYKVGNNARY